MRTTLDVDQDVLDAVKAIAHDQNKSAGKIISELARKSLEPGPRKVIKYRTRNGVPLFPFRPGGSLVTAELVKRLREETDV